MVFKSTISIFSIALILCPFTIKSASESEQRCHDGISWGVSLRQGRRPTMEDTFAAQTPFKGSSDKAFFGIYDGHGGDMVAKAVAEGKGMMKSLHATLAECNKESVVDRLKHAFLKTEESISLHCDESGATAAAVYIDRQTNTVTVAWAGDTRVLFVCGNSLYTTTDHKPTNEIDRIKSAGGSISSKDNTYAGYLCNTYGQPRLAVSRSLGDKKYKYGGDYAQLKGLVADPEIAQAKFTGSDNVFLIIASDGIWDGIPNSSAAKIVAKKLNVDASVVTPKLVSTAPQYYEDGNHGAAQLAARTLGDIAFKCGSKDNISVLVAVINTCKDTPFATEFTSESPLYLKSDDNIEE